jgi:hypothetical protein
LAGVLHGIMAIIHLTGTDGVRITTTTITAIITTHIMIITDTTAILNITAITDGMTIIIMEDVPILIM